MKDGDALWGRKWEPLFWKRVRRGTPEECWIWIGEIDRSGWPTFQVPGDRRRMGQSTSMILHTGHLTPPGYAVSRCKKNPLCVNPDHLSYRPWPAKKKLPKKPGPPRPDRRGEGDPLSRLTEKQVREIFHLSTVQRLTATKIAAMYGVHLQSIKNIHLGKTWKHLHLIDQVVNKN